jgi:hypothetical protein
MPIALPEAKDALNMTEMILHVNARPVRFAQGDAPAQAERAEPPADEA